MIQQTSKLTVSRLALASACFLWFAGCTGNVALGPDAVKGKMPDGFVEMHEVQAAYIGSGSGGGGVLSFRGGQYAFEVGGVGVGGIGLSTIEATGEVYNLGDLDQFPGTYGQARYGFAIGTASGGDLWLQNEAGVIMHLKAKRTGLMLSLGGDAVVIKMRQ
jgi:hypothetical protein